MLQAAKQVNRTNKKPYRIGLLHRNLYIEPIAIKKQHSSIPLIVVYLNVVNCKTGGI